MPEGDQRDGRSFHRLDLGTRAAREVASEVVDAAAGADRGALDHARRQPFGREASRLCIGGEGTFCGQGQRLEVEEAVARAHALVGEAIARDHDHVAGSKTCTRAMAIGIGARDAEQQDAARSRRREQFAERHGRSGLADAETPRTERAELVAFGRRSVDGQEGAQVEAVHVVPLVARSCEGATARLRAYTLSRMAMLLPTLCLLVLPQDPASTPPAAETPPRILWQRSLEDALRVQEATGKPLLVCVNQDGETFCERFAEDTYRDPAFVALTEQFVCVIASPDEHTKRDYDGRGRRVECPRFPGVTCSEHKNVEPLLFARWFRGERYAPRHVAVDLAGKVVFDRYLDGSMQTAVDAIRELGARGPSPVVPGGDVLLQRFDAGSRLRFERAFREASAADRVAMLQKAAGTGSVPIDALRMALREDDATVFAIAANVLAATADPSCAIDLHDALARCDDTALEALLESTLVRVVEGDAALVREAGHRLAARNGWKAKDPVLALRRDAPVDPFDADERDTIEAELDAALALRKQNAADAGAALRVALGHAALALLLLPEGHATVPLFLEDAARAAKALPADATAAQRAAAAVVEAVCAFHGGETETASTHAENAIELARTAGALTLPRRLALEFLRVRARTQAGAAYATAMPLTHQKAVEAAARAFAQLWTERDRVEDALEAAALLAFANARLEAASVLRSARLTFASSTQLHADLRTRLLVDRGARTLVRDYTAWADAAQDRASADWFCGYAALVAAETEVTDREGLDAERAYTVAIDRLASSKAKNADFGDSADHFAVLALAGRALERHGRGDGEGAVADLLAARALRPASLTQSDGLERKPEAILRRVQKELRERGKDELAARLD